MVYNISNEGICQNYETVSLKSLYLDRIKSIYHLFSLIYTDDYSQLVNCVWRNKWAAIAGFNINTCLVVTGNLIKMSGSVKSAVSCTTWQHGSMMIIQPFIWDYYLVYHRVQFLFLWLSPCIPVLLGSLHSDMPLNITCMLMMHSCIYHWLLIMS